MRLSFLSLWFTLWLCSLIHSLTLTHSLSLSLSLYYFGNLSTTISFLQPLYLWPQISGEIVITAIVSAIGGPISSIVSGWLGGSGIW